MGFLPFYVTIIFRMVLLWYFCTTKLSGTFGKVPQKYHSRIKILMAFLWYFSESTTKVPQNYVVLLWLSPITTHHTVAFINTFNGRQAPPASPSDPRAEVLTRDLQLASSSVSWRVNEPAESRQTCNSVPKATRTRRPAVATLPFSGSLSYTESCKWAQEDPWETWSTPRLGSFLPKLAWRCRRSWIRHTKITWRAP